MAEMWEIIPASTLATVEQMKQAIIPSLLPKNGLNIPILDSFKSWNNTCASSKVTFCFIAILDGGISNAAFKIVNLVAKRAWVNVEAANFVNGLTTSLAVQRLAISFVIADTNSQPDLLSTFRVAGQSLIALNPRRKTFSSYRGSFTEKNINDFLVSFLYKAGALGNVKSDQDFFKLPASSNPRGVKIVLETISSLPEIFDGKSNEEDEL
jgi:hypothetical protein